MFLDVEEKVKVWVQLGKTILSYIFMEEIGPFASVLGTWFCLIVKLLMLL